MNYGEIKFPDVGNGPGIRCTLWVSGCPLKCPGCFNAAAQEYNYGSPFKKEDRETIFKHLCQSYCSGMSIVGGEPFAERNIEETYKLIRSIRGSFGNQRSIWARSGYLYEELMSKTLPIKTQYRREHKEREVNAYDCIKELDVLVDGPFMIGEKDLNLKYAGSRNQRPIDIQQTLKEGRVILYDKH